MVDLLSFGTALSWVTDRPPSRPSACLHPWVHAFTCPLEQAGDRTLGGFGQMDANIESGFLRSSLSFLCFQWDRKQQISRM